MRKLEGQPVKRGWEGITEVSVMDLERARRNAARMAASLAQRLPVWIDGEVLAAEAEAAVWRAALRYSPDQCASFATWSGTVVHRSLLEEVRRQSPWTRQQRRLRRESLEAGTEPEGWMLPPISPRTVPSEEGEDGRFCEGATLEEVLPVPSDYAVVGLQRNEALPVEQTDNEHGKRVSWDETTARCVMRLGERRHKAEVESTERCEVTVRLCGRSLLGLMSFFVDLFLGLPSEKWDQVVSVIDVSGSWTAGASRAWRLIFTEGAPRGGRFSVRGLLVRLHASRSGLLLFESFDWRPRGRERTWLDIHHGVDIEHEASGSYLDRRPLTKGASGDDGEEIGVSIYKNLFSRLTCQMSSKMKNWGSLRSNELTKPLLGRGQCLSQSWRQSLALTIMKGVS